MPVQDFPIPPFGKEICHHSNEIKLHRVQEFAGSTVGDAYPPGRPGCNQRDDRAAKLIIYNVLDG